MQYWLRYDNEDIYIFIYVCLYVYEFDLLFVVLLPWSFFLRIPAGGVDGNLEGGR